MSYAAVTAANAPPISEQAHPDPALLNTAPPTHSNVADDAAKVNIVGPNFKQDPHTYTSIQEPPVDDEVYDIPAGVPSQAPRGDKHRKAKQRLHQVESESLDLWESAKQYLFRPGVAGGLIGIVNIGVFATIGRTFYARPDLRRNATAISSAVAVSVALLSAEGYGAEQYRKTPRGQEEERRAKREGALIYRHLREQIMRPGVLGGIVGLLNTAILGSLGYVSYSNWNKPWDRRIVSAVSVGLLTLWGGEGILAERFSERSS